VRFYDLTLRLAEVINRNIDLPIWAKIKVKVKKFNTQILIFDILNIQKYLLTI